MISPWIVWTLAIATAAGTAAMAPLAIHETADAAGAEGSAGASPGPHGARAVVEGGRSGSGAGGGVSAGGSGEGPGQAPSETLPRSRASTTFVLTCAAPRTDGELCPGAVGGRHAAEAGLSQVGSLVGRAVWDAPHGQPLALRITGDGRVLGETSGASPIEIALDRVGLRGATAFQLAIGNAVGGAPAIAQRVTLDLEVVGPA